MQSMADDASRNRALIRRIAERWADQLEQRKRMRSAADSRYKSLDEIIDEELRQGQRE